MDSLLKLPCSSCDAACCGSVRLTEAVHTKIIQHLRALPEAELNRLRVQKRRAGDCNLIDMKDYSCSVYPVRPEVCKLYGHTPGLVCGKVGVLVNIVPIWAVQDRMRKEYASPVTWFSGEFDWRDV